LTARYTSIVIAKFPLLPSCPGLGTGVKAKQGAFVEACWDADGCFEAPSPCTQHLIVVYDKVMRSIKAACSSSLQPSGCVSTEVFLSSHNRLLDCPCDCLGPTCSQVKPQACIARQVRAKCLLYALGMHSCAAVPVCCLNGALRLPYMAIDQFKIACTTVIYRSPAPLSRSEHCHTSLQVSITF
jgi:hypothetical protein